MLGKPRATLRAAAVAAVALTSGPALADPNDVVLSRFGHILTDGDGNAVDVVGDPEQFRSLASELGLVMAPRLNAPADTLGFGGFQFAADLAFTTVNTDQSYWRAREGHDGSGPADSYGPAALPTVGFSVRKGIGFPLPLEVAFGAVHLVDSEMWSGQSSVKLALHEGYHDLPLPSFAVRGGVSRVIGSDQIDLTTASLDLSVSKEFGIEGTVDIQPYGGWNWLFIVPRSDVIDKTPHIDPRQMSDADMNFTFRDQDTVIRNRFFGGFKLRHYLFAVTLEANLGLPGGSVHDEAGTSTRCSEVMMPSTDCDAADSSGIQQTYTITVGADF